MPPSGRSPMRALAPTRMNRRRRIAKGSCCVSAAARYATSSEGFSRMETDCILARSFVCLRSTLSLMAAIICYA